MMISYRSEPKTAVETRKARFLWLKDELDMHNSQIAELVGKAKAAVDAWSADSRPDAAPTAEALKVLKNRLLSDAEFDARIANNRVGFLERAFAGDRYPEISRVPPISDEELAFEKRQIAGVTACCFRRSTCQSP